MKLVDFNGKTIRSFIVTFFLQILGASFAFFVQVWIARNTSVDTYGKYNIIMSYVNIVSIFILVGSGQVVLRMTSVYWNKSQSKVRYYMNSTIAFVIGNWVALLVLVGLIIFIVNEDLLGIEAGVLWLVLVLVLLNGIALLLQSVARGRNRLLDSIWPLSLLKPVSTLLFIWIALSFLNILNVHNLVAIQVLVFVIICLFYLSSNFPLLAFPNIKKLTRFRSFLKKGFQRGKNYFLNGMIQILIKNLDLILIGSILSSHQAGVFASASKVNLLIIYALGAMNVVLSSKIAKHYENSELGKLNTELRKMSVVIAIFSFGLLLLIVIWGKQILLSFGVGYIDGYDVLVILTIANLIEVLFGPTGVIINMTGFQSHFSKIMVLVLLAYILLMPMAIHLFGLLGAAVVIVVIAILKNGMQGYFIYNNLKIESGLVGLLMSKLFKK